MPFGKNDREMSDMGLEIPPKEDDEESSGMGLKMPSRIDADFMRYSFMGIPVPVV